MLVYLQFVELDSGHFVFINWVLIKCRQPAKKLVTLWFKPPTFEGMGKGR